MNKQLKTINQERVLFFDLECVRKSGELDINSKEFELFRKKTRNRETDEYLPNDEVIELYKSKGALKMCYTKIVTIGVGFIKGEEVHIKSLEGTEEDIIRQFCNIAQNFDYLCGSNVIAFDAPMIINNGYRYFDVSSVLADKFITSGKKQWELKSYIDLQEIFKGSHYYASSVDEMCYHFGLDSPKDGIDGSQVSEEYYKNGLVKISQYVKKDVFACVNLFKKMRFEQAFEGFIDKNKSVESTEIIEEQPLLQRIYSSKNFGEKEKQQLKDILAKKKITAKERNIILDLVRASLSEIDKNFGKVNNIKQVDEIINQLREEI